MCLHFGGLSQKLVLKLTLDEYSSVKVGGLFSKIKSASEVQETMALQAASATGSDYVLLTQSYVFPIVLLLRRQGGHHTQCRCQVYRRGRDRRQLVSQ